MVDAIKIGAGAFFILLGIYLVNKFSDSISIIGGIVCIAIGLGIIAKAK